MDPGQMIGRGIAFPPRLGADGRLAWSTGEQNVRESIQIILLTRLRERLMLPDFGAGLDAFLFEPNTVATRHLLQDRIATALTQWEPRIVVEAITVDPDPDSPTAAIATIIYRLVATEARERLRVTIELAA
jgi:phage baseplate assembly protein W